MDRFKLLCEYNYWVDKTPFKLHEEDDDFDLDPDMGDMNDMDGDTAPPDAGTADVGGQPAEGNVVEVDISDIVRKQEEMLASINNMVSSMENTINGINSNFKEIDEKIESNNRELKTNIGGIESTIKQELVKRVPTPNETIQLQSMSSFPYSIKLSDYWKADKNSEEYKYSIANPNQKQNSLYSNIEKQAEIPQEFELKYSDISNYNNSDISRSF